MSTRRGTELGLLLIAGLVTAGAYALSALGRTASLPADIGPFLAAVIGLPLVAHLVCRRLVPYADPVLLPLAALLNGIGYVFIARLDADLAAAQATWTLVGVGAFVAVLVVVRDMNDVRRYQWTLGVLGLGILLLPLVPGLGFSVGGARLWIRVGPLTFQPGEAAKVLLACFFAAYLVERREVIAAATRRLGPLRVPEPRDLLPVLGAWAVSIVIMVSQRDLGSSLLFFTLFVVVLWVATERATYLVLGSVLFAAGAYLAWSAFAHVQDRVAIWLNPWATPTTTGYQVIQGGFSLAWGGLTGTGLGLGDPGRVPAAATDFILAAIGEEMGLLGTGAVVIGFILLVGSGLRIALAADRPFEKLLATGLTTILGVQAFIIMGGVTRLVPLTGVTLPFVSYGGSSLVANYVLLAMLMRISDTSTRRALGVPTR